MVVSCGLMMAKMVLRGGIYFIVFVNVFLLNVILHEAGHYMAAGYYELEPEIEFNFENMGDLGFQLRGISIASTSFNEPESNEELVVIVLLGPLFNFVLAVIFLFIFAFSKKEMVREIVMIGFVISFASFFMNVIPIDGTDGGLIFGF